ncbi:MAG TPA: hypothetical protein VEH07_01520, partial [Alphaproteobacteria bacterium]|nr:hypothetical protein [Alphaproteobacteria bacterium]
FDRLDEPMRYGIAEKGEDGVLVGCVFSHNWTSPPFSHLCFATGDLDQGGGTHIERLLHWEFR